MAQDRPSFADLTARQKLIVSGLYLAKFDSLGLKGLGFDSFIEAFNVIGYALGSRPASVKNYRDEFDPFFPNRRKGWHKRPTRDYCREIYEKFKGLNLAEFTGLVRSFFGFDSNTRVEDQQAEEIGDASARRIFLRGESRSIFGRGGGLACAVQPLREEVVDLLLTHAIDVEVVFLLGKNENPVIVDADNLSGADVDILGRVGRAGEGDRRRIDGQLSALAAFFDAVAIGHPGYAHRRRRRSRRIRIGRRGLRDRAVASRCGSCDRLRLGLLRRQSLRRRIPVLALVLVLVVGARFGNVWRRLAGAGVRLRGRRRAGVVGVLRIPRASTRAGIDDDGDDDEQNHESRAGGFCFA